MKTRRSARLAASAKTTAEVEKVVDAKVEAEVVGDKPIGEVAGTTEVEKKDEARLLPDVLMLCPEEHIKIQEGEDKVVHLNPGPLPLSYFSCSGEDLAESSSDLKKSILKPDFEQRDQAPRFMKSKYTLMKERQLARGQSAGDKWFNMGAPVLTSSLKQDLKLLRMRNTLDPAHHYKASDMDKGIPRYFQEGRVLEDHSEFYSARIPRRSRKQTLAEELMSDDKLQYYRTQKYQELQEKRSSGQHRLSRVKFKRKFKNSKS